MNKKLVLIVLLFEMLLLVLFSDDLGYVVSSKSYIVLGKWLSIEEAIRLLVSFGKDITLCLIVIIGNVLLFDLFLGKKVC